MKINDNWNAKICKTLAMVSISKYHGQMNYNWNAKRVTNPYTWFQVDINIHTTKIDHN